MMKKILRYMTIWAVAVLLVGCAQVEESAEPKGSGAQTSDVVDFDVYTQRSTRSGTKDDVTTASLQTDTHKNDGFGVFAYYTEENNYSSDFIPNFMYNQQVKYNSSDSKFTYEPQKYWPNEDNHHVSFFAYAPWVAVTASTGAAADQTYGITGMTKNTATGDPMIHYVATTDLSKGVDLCWNSKLNQVKSDNAVNFTLAHALSKLNVKVQTSVGINTNTKIYIRSITFSGFTMKGSLNLNSSTAQWTAYEKGGPLNKDAVTFYDGRRDGREGYVADDSELPVGLNPDLVQSTLWDNASPKPGVTNTAKNLFTSATATDPAYVIPTGDPVDITIEYDIETADPKLQGYFLSDGKTNGTSIANRITKTGVLTSLDAGKSYTITLNLGLKDVTFNATSVKEWKSDDPERVPLTFEAKIAETKVTFTKHTYEIYVPDEGVQYSVDDGDTWEDYTFGTDIMLNNIGDKVSFKSLVHTCYCENGGCRFITDKDCYVYGNILSLVNFSKTLTDDHTFALLFLNSDKIVNHPTYDLLLPATVLTDNCYASMFSGCKGLTRAPELPATTLTYRCYADMFEECTSLVSAPSLPATTLAKECYYYMFNKCTSLTSAPAILPALTMAENCCVRMFSGCTALSSAPELPATTLAKSCYSCMFDGCINLISAPALPATIMAEKCYYQMFKGCSRIITAPEMNISSVASQCCESMFEGCTNLNSIPTLSATTLANQCYIKMFKNCTNLTSAPSLPATTLAKHCYCEMFSGCSNLTTAPALPATTLAEGCFSGMFSGCSNLTTAPALPATTIANGCYYDMFRGCTGLTTAPALPAETLTYECYRGMFYGCTNLTTAPALPATTLADYCYSGMFRGCTGLTTAPVLPAPDLVSNCYSYMFYGCINLNWVKCLASSVSASYCKNQWLGNVASSGTFIKASSISETSWSRGINGIPTGWTVVDAQ